MYLLLFIFRLPLSIFHFIKIETQGKREKIEEFLRTIEDRLKTLEEEKEELKEYQKWDKIRRAVEYTIHDRELKETRKKLDDMENTRKDSGDRQDKLRQQLERAQENSKSASRELRDLKHRAQAAREERDTLNAEQQQLLKEKSKLELTIKVCIFYLLFKVLCTFP